MVTEKPIISADQVADWFVAWMEESGEPIQVGKVMALMYFAQAWHLALHDRPLFEGDFEAGPGGPVHRPTLERLSARFRSS